MYLSIAATVAGILLIGFTIFDVFVTVLHPQAESPFSSRLQLGVWAIMRLAARGLPGRSRHRLLGLAVPLMIAVLVAVWIGVILIAFGLIYAAWIDVPGAFRSADPSVVLDWTDALYFSGVTLGTIGYGDVQPVEDLLRILAVIEGFSGVAILSLSIAYVLELYPVLQRQSVLAVLLNEETAGKVGGLPMLERYLRNSNFDALADLLRIINLELLYLAEAHRRLPVLHYIHPTDVERSFLRVLLVVRNLVGVLRYGMAGGEGRAWGEDPRVQDLEDSLFYTLHTLGSSQNLPLTGGAGDKRAQEIDEQFGELEGRLKSMGLPSPNPEPGSSGKTSEMSRAHKQYVHFFLTSDVPIESYLRNTGYTQAEAVRDAARPEKLVIELESDAAEQS